jgi:hypothetical protein
MASPITWFSADLEDPAPLSTNLLAIPARLSLVFVSSLLAHLVFGTHPGLGLTVLSHLTSLIINVDNELIS